MAESALDALLARDAEERCRDALHRASLALDALAGLGIEARLVGSLARGGFARHSDIDILILACPPDWRYRLECVVEDDVGGFPFDVIYLDEVKPHRRERLIMEARDAPDLCRP